MLYVCSIPLNADVGNTLGAPVCIVDILPYVNSRRNINYEWWENYKKAFSYSRFWIVEPGELADRVVVDIKYHLGET